MDNPAHELPNQPIVSHDDNILFVRHPDPMWVYDLETLAFLAVNDAAVLAYGYSRQEFLQMTIRDIRPPDDLDRLVKNIAALDEGIDHAGYWTHIHKSGARRTVDITSEVIEFKGRQAELVCARDVTQQQALADKLAQARKLEAIGILTGGIAHDFNNLLTVILGNSELICELTEAALDGSDDVSELGEIQELASMVTAAAERGADLTQKLLSYARRQVLTPRPTDLNAVIRNLEPMFRHDLGLAITLNLALTPAIGLCNVDAQRLETVIQNLVTNAQQAMPRGGAIELRTENITLAEVLQTRHATLQPGHYICLSVRDQGHGMSSDVLEHVFEPFFTTRPPGKHSGLGLSVVHGFIKQSSGHIDIETAPGRGTTVSLYFPGMEPSISNEHGSLSTPGAERDGIDEIRTGNADLRADPSGDVTHALLHANTECILVVEDDLLVRRHMTSLLTEYGYRVMEASGPDEALDLVEQHPDIDLLLTDVLLGVDMDGRTLAEEVRNQNAKIGILFCSGYSGLTLTRDGGMPAGSSLLPKPYTREALLKAVRSALSRH